MSSELTTPFDTLVADVVSAVADGLNVLVTGPPGAGQASFVESLVDELTFDRRAVRIVGTQAWRRKPFAALSILKSARPTDVIEARVQPPRRVRYTEQLMDAAGATGVVVVERPEWLDSDSAGVIAVASRQGRIPIVAVSSQSSPHRASAALVNDLAPALRLSMPLLRLEEIHSLVQTLLGGPVESETVARIAAQSAGLYDMVVGMTTVARRSGALTENADGWWHAVSELVTGDMGGWVEHTVAGISERQRDILRRLTAAAALGEDYTVGSRESTELGRLMDIGLVREQGGRLNIYPPLLADYVRSQRHVIHRDAVSLSAATSGDLESAMVLNAGRYGSASDVALSHSIRRKGLATVDASRAAWTADPSAVTAIPLLVALQNTGAEPDAIKAVVEQTRYEPETSEYALMRVWWATYLSLTLTRLDDGLGSLQPLEDDAPNWHALVQAARAHLTLAAGRDARPGPGESTDAGPAAGDDLGLGHVVTLDRLLIAGRSRSVLDATAPPLTGVHPVFATAVTLSTTTAMIFEGRVAEAIDAARSELIEAERARNLGLVYAHAYVKMLGLVVAGRAHEARRLLNRVLTLGTARALHEPYQVGILDLGVVIETLRGEPARAAVLAETVVGITGVGARRGGLPGMGGLSAQRVYAPDDVAGRLWSTALYCQETGQLVTAVFAGLASLSARFDPGAAEMVQKWSTKAESPLLRVLGRFGVALDRKSPETLLALADDFLSVGAGLYFGRARVQAARGYYERGDATRGFQLASDTWDKTGFMGPDRAGLFSELWHEIGMSDREAQVSRSANLPGSARDIATLLHLSQRTVENYLYSAYRKSGTTSREALADACAQWLRAPAAGLVGPLI